MANSRPLHHPPQGEYYPRFFDSFSSKGEVNMPVDGQFISTPEFKALVCRLHVQTTSQHRDCWCAHAPGPPDSPPYPLSISPYHPWQPSRTQARRPESPWTGEPEKSVDRRLQSAPRVACELCNRWRELSAEQMAAVEGVEQWTCSAAYLEARLLLHSRTHPDI